RRLLAARGVAARVVSVPCFELFGSVPADVRAVIIGAAPAQVGIEAAIRQGWDAIIGSDGAFVGMKGFGAKIGRASCRGGGVSGEWISGVCACGARRLLAARGVAAGVVSVPCFELFGSVPADVRAVIIGAAPAQVGIEAAIRQGWDAIIGSDGAFVGMTGFGASAPGRELYRHFGIVAERCAEAAMAKLAKRSNR